MGLEILISLTVFAVVAWYIALPLLTPGHGAPSSSAQNFALEDLTLKKKEVLLALKDLELDYNMQKISEEDYRSSYDETFAQGKILLQEIEAAKDGRPLEGRAESAGSVSGAATSPAPTGAQAEQGHVFCIHCGQRLPVQARFCLRCGEQTIS